MAEPVTANRIDDPDVDYELYSLKKLFDILRSHNSLSSFDYIVGVSRFKITDNDYTTMKTIKSYFSLSDFDKVSVISLHDEVLRFNSSSKNDYQYVTYLMMCEILINMVKKDLSHHRSSCCLFDDCEDRSDFSKCIDDGRICETCIAKLKQFNVGDGIINDVLKTLRWCRRNSVKFSVGQTFTNSLTTFALGIGAGWLASLSLRPGYYQLILLAVICLPLGVFIYNRYFAKRIWSAKSPRI